MKHFIVAGFDAHVIEWHLYNLRVKTDAMNLLWHIEDYRPR